jgi:hypothetical protein
MNVDLARKIGQEILGPIFTGWGHLLLRAASRRRLRRMFFVARDGFLLQQVCAELLKLEDLEEPPSLEYLHLSRRSTLLPARGTIDAEGIESALAVRAGELTLASLLEYHGIVEEHYLPVLGDLDTTPETPVISPRQGLQLLKVAELGTLMEVEAAEQRAALLDFLLAGHDIASGSAALVDIGWRGSIQRNLSQALLSIPHLAPPAGLYLGLWREDGAAAALPRDAEGLLGDLRRGRTLHESAPWQASLLLEAICRADEGSTQCFHMIDGRGAPIIANSLGQARSAERAGNKLAEAVREGIVDHIQHHAHEDRWRCAEAAVLRHELQACLLRLAFFPSPEEIRLGEHLVHSESHDLRWNAPLVLPRPAHPLRSPRQWLAGLASPWRGGYVMATSRFAARIHRSAESILIALPPRSRENVRRVALRLAQSRPATSYSEGMSVAETTKK